MTTYILSKDAQAMLQFKLDVYIEHVVRLDGHEVHLAGTAKRNEVYVTASFRDSNDRAYFLRFVHDDSHARTVGSIMTILRTFDTMSEHCALKLLKAVIELFEEVDCTIVERFHLEERIRTSLFQMLEQTALHGSSALDERPVSS